MAASDTELLALGRAVHAALEAPHEWPRIMRFELDDHIRRIELYSPAGDDGGPVAVIKFPDGVF
jgi:hypothetical protein